MGKFLAKTRKINGEIVVALPKEVIEGLSLRENQFVEITIKKQKANGFGALKGTGPFTVEDELKAHD